jgi:hypothetical protein
LALFDPVSITRAIEAKPFAGAPNIVIAYPQRDDWMKLYRPQPLRMPDAQGIYRNVDAFDARYLDMKRHHENTVLKRLCMIQDKAAGRAVIAELKSHPSFSVYILPFDFMPSGDWAIGIGAVTETLTMLQTPAERTRGATPAGTQYCKNGACRADMESRTGNSVDVFYTASRATDSQADGWLLHELVHAARMMAGVFQFSQIGGSYGNQEEFYASTIEMIYRSEKKLPVYDYHYQPFDPAKFLQHNRAIVLLSDLRTKQPSLYDALTKVNAQFNPIKQIEDQRRKLMGG